MIRSHPHAPTTTISLTRQAGQVRNQEGLGICFHVCLEDHRFLGQPVAGALELSSRCRAVSCPWPLCAAVPLLPLWALH